MKTSCRHFAEEFSLTWPLLRKSVASLEWSRMQSESEKIIPIFFKDFPSILIYVDGGFFSRVYFLALAPLVSFSHLSTGPFYHDNVSCKVRGRSRFSAPPLPHCIAFARGHRETAENLCRYTQSFPLRLDLCNRYFDYEHQTSEFNLPLNGSMRQLVHPSDTTHGPFFTNEVYLSKRRNFCYRLMFV